MRSLTAIILTTNNELMKRKFIIAAIAVAAFIGVQPAASAQKTSKKAQEAVTAKIIEEGTDNNQTMVQLDYLANRFGGRIVGSPNYTAATYWCADQFRKWGFDVEVQEVGEVPLGFNRGPWSGRIVGIGDSKTAFGSGTVLHFTTPSYTSGTKGVQRGHVVREPLTTRDFERMKGKIKGAWVLIGGTNNGWPIDWGEAGENQRAIDKAYNDSIAALPRNRAEGATLRQTPALFYKEMIEAGALGIIQSAKVPITTLYDRKNLMDMSFDNLPTLPDIKLDSEQYDMIAAMVDRNEYFQLEFDIRNNFYPGPVKYHNVIATIKGSKYPDEYVIVGGHLDAFDSATGGVDDGNGASVALEVGRMLSAAGATKECKPLRSIQICLWAAEEYGLWGSKYFVEHCSKDKIKKISNYFNRDSGPTVPVAISVTDAMYDDMVAIAEPLKNYKATAAYPLQVVKRQGAAGPRPTTAGGSDHAYFAMNGVPTMGFQLGDPCGYDFQYGEIWHTDRDTYQMSYPDYQEQSSTITAVFTWGLANLSHILSRDGLYTD